MARLMDDVRTTKMNNRFIMILVLGALLAGCMRQDGPTPTQPADTHRGALTETETRKLATDFKQAWMAEHPAEIEQIGQATIREVNNTATGWHVVFEQIRFPGQPEGESHHFLHIYLDSKGTLEKIERGPDVIT